MEKPQREEREGKSKWAGSYPESNRISYNVGDRSPRFKLSVSTVSCLPLNEFHTLTEPQSWGILQKYEVTSHRSMWASNEIKNMKVLYQISITYTEICVGVSLNKRAVESQEYCEGGLRDCSVTVSFQANLKCLPLKKNVDEGWEASAYAILEQLRDKTIQAFLQLQVL